MLTRIVCGPEAAGFVVVGATIGAVLTGAAHAGPLVVWAGGTGGALLFPCVVALPWEQGVRGLAERIRHWRSPARTADGTDFRRTAA